MKSSLRDYYILTAVLLVIGIGGAFYGGTRYQADKDSSKTVATTASAAFNDVGGGTSSGGYGGGGATGGGYGGGIPGGGGSGYGGGRGGFAGGVIQSVDGSTITVQTQSGEAETINVGSGTTISKTVTGALSDLTTGETIIVNGSTNSDGSVDATTIQVRPAAAATPDADPAN